MPRNCFARRSHQDRKPCEPAARVPVCASSSRDCPPAVCRSRCPGQPRAARPVFPRNGRGSQRDCPALLPPPPITSSKCGASCIVAGVPSQVAHDQRRPGSGHGFGNRPRARNRTPAPIRRSRLAPQPPRAASATPVACGCRSRSSIAESLRECLHDRCRAIDFGPRPASRRRSGLRGFAPDVDHLSARANQLAQPTSTAKSTFYRTRLHPTSRPPSEKESGVAFRTPDDRHALAWKDRRRNQWALLSGYGFGVGHCLTRKVGGFRGISGLDRLDGRAIGDRQRHRRERFAIQQ